MAKAKLDPAILAHLEWLGFVRPTGLVVSAPALVRAGAILDRRDGARWQNLLEASRNQVGFESEPFRDAVSGSLELMGAKRLEESRDEHGHRVWTFPRPDRRAEVPTRAGPPPSTRSVRPARSTRSSPTVAARRRSGPSFSRTRAPRTPSIGTSSATTAPRKCKWRQTPPSGARRSAASDAAQDTE
jgi:hypothetical protein